MSDAPARWVTVMTVMQPFEAQLARSKLESDGIDCFLPEEHSIAAHPAYAIALGGIRVQVRPEDLERARESLLPAEEGQRWVRRDRSVCPRCGLVSLHVGEEPLARAWRRLKRLMGFEDREVCARCARRR
jgi:hypothetical protein